MTTTKLFPIGLLSILYVTLGAYAVTYIPNPFLNNFPIAFNMTIVVFAGIVFGKKTGMWVGITGAVLGVIAALLLKPFTASYLFSISNIIPHAIMGYLAGVLADRYNPFLGSLSIIAGHTLNIIVFLLGGLFTLNRINAVFWQSITYETMIDIIAINMLGMIFLISFPFIKEKW
jgi:hypothetical protein